MGCGCGGRVCIANLRRQQLAWAMLPDGATAACRGFLADLLVFHNHLSALSLLGAGLICASSFFVAYDERRTRLEQQAQVQKLKASHGSLAEIGAGADDQTQGQDRFRGWGDRIKAYLPARWLGGRAGGEGDEERRPLVASDDHGGSSPVLGRQRSSELDGLEMQGGRGGEDLR